MAEISGFRLVNHQGEDGAGRASRRVNHLIELQSLVDELDEKGKGR